MFVLNSEDILCTRCFITTAYGIIPLPVIGGKAYNFLYGLVHKMATN
jgi:hypothetical protein